MDDCIFCKIVNGEIPSDKLYENEGAMAFSDLNPLAPVHVLVVPKAHHDNILDGVDADTLSAMVDCVSHVVALKGIKESGFRVITNSGPDSGQAVQHLHWHILGGKRLTDQLA